MKITYVKFHQPIRIGTEYQSHVFLTEDMSLSFEQGMLKLSSPKIKNDIVVFASNIESMEAERPLSLKKGQ